MSTCVLTDLGGDQLVVGIDVGGFMTTNLGGMLTEEAVQSIFDALPSNKYRKDDIVLCTYQKTGTNWLYEILSMINNKSAERVKTSKTETMIECIPAEKMAELPSPRVLNSHLPARLLPKDHSVTKPKTVLCFRNPKDTAVSYFNHMKGIKGYEYNGQFSNWLPLYLQGKLEYGKYTDYLIEWEKAINDGTDFPLHLMYYEDLKLDGAHELDRLLKFLEVDLDETLKSDILEACGFANMATSKFPKELAEKVFNNGFNFFRKGLIGDWKNWFTVAENEMFDSIWKSEMKDSKLYKFIYTDPRANQGN